MPLFRYFAEQIRERDTLECSIGTKATSLILPSTAIEAEEVITNSPLDVDYAERNGEIRIRQVGETAAGRMLVVISTLRDNKTRVVTAYPPNQSLQAAYLNYKGYVKDGKENPS